MAALTPNELIDWLIQNRFLSETRAQPFRSPPAAYGDTMSLARDLMQRNCLSAYQVNQILQGKRDELMLGPYRLLERLGEGAMGQVFKAWNCKLERVVAIKKIHREHLASKKAMDRFRREMETAGQLEHPNIVRLRDADEIDNHPFMVMNFVDGTDLARLVKQEGPLPIWQAADYARQTALGLQHAFERGVVHRDIKPGNLLVTRDSAPVVKISDFGLARLESERGTQGRLTQIGAVLGTVDYIAPEQAENAQVADIRADLYSLGCTLYFLLTANPPFSGTNIVEKIGARLSGEPIDIRTYRPEVPAGLIAVLKRLIARNPADRFQTPQEAAAALQPFCARDASAGTEIQPVARSPVDVHAGIPLAIPIALPVHADQDPFRLNEADPGSTSVTADYVPAAPETPRARVAAKKQPLVLYALSGGAGMIVLVILLVQFRGCGAADSRDVYPPDAALEITLKEAGRTMNHGDRKFLLFEVKRTKFTGKVEVSLEKLPEGVQAEKVLLDSNKKHGQIPITVSFGTRSTQRALRVRAVAKNLAAEASFNLTIRGPEE